MSSGIKVAAPATISNINCGFDVLGLALDYVCDEIIGRRTNKTGLHLKLVGPNARSTPADPTRNTVTVAIQAMLDHIGESKPVSNWRSKRRSHLAQVLDRVQLVLVPGY